LTQLGELTIVILVTSLSVHQTDRSTELFCFFFSVYGTVLHLYW